MPGPPEPRGIIWPPGWVVLPGGRGGIPRDGLRPCPCGRTKFALADLPDGRPTVYCPDCCKPRRGQQPLRVLAWIDARTGTITPAR